MLNRECMLKAISKVCKIKRISNCITQEDMAKHTGYSKSNISMFENANVNNALLMMEYIITDNVTRYDIYKMIGDIMDEYWKNLESGE